MSTRRYKISIGEDLDREVREAAAKAGISFEEAFRRAIVLFKHAVSAERVTLVTNGPYGPHEQRVLVR
jgi:hypothetical protein